MFPLGEEIDVEAGLRVHHSLVNELIGPLLTPARREKIARVVGGRRFSTAVVLEGIYDRGNVSAVMRTAEGLGYASFHVIETQEKFKEANRVTQGADKWVETRKWKSTAEAVHHLKDQGFRLVVTSLENSRPMHEVDFRGRTALVLGNEKDGASAEILAAADERVIIPMAGFVQSFNISVAGALSLYHIQRDLALRGETFADLNETQKSILTAHYYLRTQDSAPDVLRRHFEGKSFA